MTIKVRIANEEPPGGDKVLSIHGPLDNPWEPEVRLSGGQEFVVVLTAASEFLLTETDREPCDGPAALPQEAPSR